MELKKTQEILDRQIILKFELDTLKGFLFDNNFERWVPECTPKRIHNHHIRRYEFALNFTKNKKVLDIACGAGYGTFLIATEGNAESVVGVDLSEAAIAYGNAKYAHPCIQRIQTDAQSFKHAHTFDLVTCFETIEHLPNYRDFLNNMKSLLRKDALILISTPVVESTRTNCDNPYHVIEWSFHDFHTLLKEHFEIEKIYVQNIEFKQKFQRQTTFNRIARKLIRPIQKAKIPVVFEEWEGQFPITEIASGYQIVVLRNV